MSKKKDSLKPWLSRPAINRSVTLPLTRPLTQRLSNLNEFHPNELDPYLLFDARDSMIGTLENPTLDLDPSKPDTLNVITATRAGTATFTDANGLIASAPANTVRVDQTQGAELTPKKFQRFGQTEFDQWTKGSNTTVTANATQAPDGSMTGYRLHMNSSAGTFLRQTMTVNSPTVFSVYIKASAESIAAGTNVLEMQVDLTYPTFTATEQWQRVSYVISGTLSNDIVGFNDGVVGHTDLYIWGPQLEEGTTATDFVANTTGSPKFITGATFGPRVPMILIEPSATNLVTYSEDFSQWVETGDIETTSNFTVSPDGTQNATKLELTGSSSGTDGKISFPVSTVSQTHTFSVYAKKGSHNYIYIWMAITGGNITRWISLDDGSHSGNGTATLTTTEVGNDWWRIEYTFDATNLYNIRLEVAENFTSTGTGGDNVYIWGAQLEAGSVATSYIPTSGGDAAARTRAADDLVISGSDFSDFYNGSEGTFYLELVDRNPTIGVHSFLRGQDINRDFLVSNGAGTKMTSFDGSSFLVQDGLVIDQLSRAAVSYESGARSLSFNGSSPNDGGNNAINWASADRLQIGNGNTFIANMHVKRVIFWPYHKDNL